MTVISPTATSLSGPGATSLLLNALADALIALACFIIVLAIIRIVRRRADLAMPYRRIARRVSVFLIVVGAAAVLALAELFYTPAEWIAPVRFGLAVAGLAALIAVWRMPKVIAALPSHADVRRANARLIAEGEAHMRTLRELRAIRDELEMRVAERTHDLDDARLRYEVALRGSEVALFIQDENLRYLWASRPLFGLGLSEEQIVGRSDEEIMPEASRTRVVALKRLALESGETQDAELSIATEEGTGWWDIHVEPISGSEGLRLYCAAVDVTERKENEQHLRFLMREVTHRSKNMLAVIQAMARQTGANSDSIEHFLERFGTRLQSLSASQDLLVQETGAGVPLDVLVRSQLGHASDMIGGQVRLEGPTVALGREATQHLGLAVHELATNAAKYGALSEALGVVEISWEITQAQGNEPARFLMGWRESGGPVVTTPSRRGFGQVVIERTVARALDGEVEMSFAPEGVVWRLRAPAANVLYDANA